MNEIPAFFIIKVWFGFYRCIDIGYFKRIILC